MGQLLRILLLQLPETTGQLGRPIRRYRTGLIQMIGVAKTRLNYLVSGHHGPIQCISMDLNIFYSWLYLPPTSGLYRKLALINKVPSLV